MSLVILRVVAVLALILLLINPASSRRLPAGDQPIVLLDASLSMRGANGSWSAALDSARRLARRGAVVWRFGSRVTAFDTTPPADGASQLGPALEAAAGRAGEVIVLTDGDLDDVTGGAIPSDLLRRPRVIVEPRPPFFDAYVAGVAGPRHVTRADTVRLRVSYGAGGIPDARSGRRNVTLVVRSDGRELLAQRVALPDGGVLSQELTLPASRIPHPGWSVLEVGLDGVKDAEPRDDKREFVVDVSLEPAAVLFASPPDWEARFLARTLTDVARVPVKMFVETEPGRWRDAATLAPVPAGDLTRGARNARLTIAAAIFSLHVRACRRAVGLAAAGDRGDDHPRFEPHAGGRVDGATRAPGFPATRAHARTARRTTGRYRLGGRSVALGISGWRRRGGVSHGGRRTGGLAAGTAGSGEQGAGGSGRAGSTERNASRVALDVARHVPHAWRDASHQRHDAH